MLDSALPLAISPPRITEDLPGIRGRIRTTPEDFRVDEIPAYEPCGEGEHLFVRFEKRALNTAEAVERIAQELGVDARGAGWAGMKDRHAVTTQWVSFQGADPARARAIEVEGIRVLEAEPHRNKLRTGHLRGNRFVLRVREVDGGAEEARRVMERLEAEGVPNYFGEQRFGRGGANIERAHGWLIDGGRAPRKKFQRKLLVSSLQSLLFNALVAERVREGSLGRPWAGDLLRKEDTGGLFVTEDLEEARRRMASWEVSATGPMFGAKMRWPEGEAAAREREVLARWGLDEERLARFARDGQGTRRPIRIRPTETSVEPEDGGETLRVAFTLPSGSYATVAMAELLRD